MRPRSSRKSSRKRGPSPKLRKTSTPPRRTMNPSLANAIKSMTKLRKTSPRRMMNPSLANAIRGMSMNKLRKNLYLYKIHNLIL